MIVNILSTPIVQFVDYFYILHKKMMSSINLSSECRWIYAFNLFERYIFSNAMTKKSILLDHQLLKQFNLCILLNWRRRNSTSFIGAFCLALNHKAALLPLVKGFFPAGFPWNSLSPYPWTNDKPCTGGWSHYYRAQNIPAGSCSRPSH